MFGIFKKKKHDENQTYRTLMKLKDEDFVSSVRNLVFNMPPNACVQTMVAWMELRPMLKCIIELEKERPGKGPANIEDLIISLGDMKFSESREIAKRRTQWFIIAGLVKRATDIADGNRQLKEEVLDIWSYMVESGYCLEGALANNVIWNDKEKIWFKRLDGISYPADGDGVGHVASHIVPQWLRKEPRLKEITKKHGVWVF
jgi:hypothetical protein